MTVPEVMATIEKDIIFYDDSGGGVTFSGGEPLLQPEFLFGLLAACRQRDIHTLIDTSGHARPDLFQKALRLTDGVLFDLKCLDATEHEKYTGVNNELILTNFKTAAASGKVQVRLPVIPGITDHLRNIEGLVEMVAAAGSVKRFDLLPYHGTAAAKYRRLGLEYRMDGTAEPTCEQMRELQERIEGYGFAVHVGG